MIEDQILKISCRNAENAAEFEHAIGSKPYRSYEGQENTFVIQYDMSALADSRIQKRIVDYVASKGKLGPALLIDVAVFFPEHLASKRVRVSPQLARFALLAGATLEYSVYKTSN